MVITNVVGWIFALLLCTPISTAAPGGEVFTTLDYADAFAKAKADGLVLLIDATAEWCGPCKRMERETWAAPEVIEALAGVALPIQVDVDKQPELAGKLGISAMPTLIAVRGGQEIDRHVGYLGVKDFLAWFADVRAGVSSHDVLLEQDDVLQESKDEHARYEMAGQLVAIGQYDRALLHYLWLWEEIDDSSSLSGVRISFMVSEMARLARLHPPAMQAFDELQQALYQRVESALQGISRQEWQDWLALSEKLEGGAQILAWFETRKVQGEVVLPPGPATVRRDLFQFLVRKERLADAALLGADLRKHASSHIGMFKGVAQDMGGRIAPELMEQLLLDSQANLRQTLASYYAVALLADSTDDAEHIAGRLIDLVDDPESRMALVSAALETGLPPSRQLGMWLDEAAKRGEPVDDLREQLERAGG